MPHQLTIPRVCEQCGDPFLAEPYQVKRGGARYCSRHCANISTARPQTLEERFWRFVNKTASCWLWTGATDRKGYGRITVDGTPLLTHRVSWELANGTIPDALCVLHNCPGGDNPTCCNPAHLFLGNRPDNNADMQKKGRYARGEQSRHSSLTDATVLAIRAEYAAGGVSQRLLAQRHAVSQSVISEIIARKAWTHLP